MPERIAAELPSLAALSQRLVYLRTLIGHYAREAVPPGSIDGSPGTDTTGVCMDNRDRMAPGEPGDRLIDDTAPLVHCPA